jgi:transposase
MRPKGSAAELERRRRQAVESVGKGIQQVTVAQVMGVSCNSVSRWVKLATLNQLAAKPHPGPTPRLNSDQEQQLVLLLQKGARAHGWPNDLWTATRVSAVISRTFGIDYHVEHVRHLLKDRLNWSSQRPEQRAYERDEAEIARWKHEELPRIKKRGPAPARSYCPAG